MWEITRNRGAHRAWLLKPTISKFSYSSYVVITIQNLEILLSLFLLLLNAIFLVIGRNYASIITTFISTITVLVSDSVICFKYFMPMNRGVDKKVPTFFSPRFAVLQEIHYQLFLHWSNRLFRKLMHFECKTNFFLQHIAGRFWSCCFMYMCLLGRFFTVLPSWDYASCLHTCVASIWSLLIKLCSTIEEFMAIVSKLQAVTVFLF